MGSRWHHGVMPGDRAVEDAMVAALKDVRAHIEDAQRVERTVERMIVEVLRNCGLSDRRIADTLGISRNRIGLLCQEHGRQFDHSWAVEWIESIWATARSTLGHWVVGSPTSREGLLSRDGLHTPASQPSGPVSHCACAGYHNTKTGDEIRVYTCASRDRRQPTTGKQAPSTSDGVFIVEYLTHTGERRRLSMLDELGLSEGDQYFSTAASAGKKHSRKSVHQRITHAVEQTFQILPEPTDLGVQLEWQ